MHRISPVFRNKWKPRRRCHLHDSSSPVCGIIYRIFRSDPITKRSGHITSLSADTVSSIYKSLRRALSAICHRTYSDLCIRQYGLYSIFNGRTRFKTRHASLERVNRHKYFLHNNSCLYIATPVIHLYTWLTFHITFVYYNTICHFCTQKVGRIQNCCYVLYTPCCSK